jgi:acyl carrier protein
MEKKDVKSEINLYFKNLKKNKKYNNNLDSLEFVNLILKIQEKFEIKFQLNELNNIKKIDELKKILLKKCLKK